MITRPLPTGPDVLALPLGRLDCHRQGLLDRRIALVEQVRNDARIAVQAQGQLGQVI